MQVVFTGMLIGSIFWGSFCDLYGRKLSMQYDIAVLDESIFDTYTVFPDQ